MAESFGARLRQHREARQIDLVAIAEQTKIKLTLLEALEQDDVSHWPSGIFRRAYIRTYAQFIGLDPDAIAREFLEAHPHPGDLFASLGGVQDDEARRDGPPPTRLRTMVDSAIASLARRRRQPAAEDPAPPANVQMAGGRAAATGRDVPAALSGLPGVTEDAQAKPAVELEADVPVFSAEGLEPFADAMTAPTAVVAVGAAAADDSSVPPAPDQVGMDRERARAREVQTLHDSTFETVARICTDLGQVATRDELPPLLHDSARVLEAAGLIVWVWDDRANGLRPALVHGYSERVLAQLPTVRQDADNATAAAFRSRQVCEVSATPHASAALVVPLLVPDACAGVMAVELQHGVEVSKGNRAAAAVLAASMAQLVDRSQRLDNQPPAKEAETVPAVAMFRPPARPVRVRR
jgi:hypothetical protein